MLKYLQSLKKCQEKMLQWDWQCNVSKVFCNKNNGKIWRILKLFLKYKTIDLRPYQCMCTTAASHNYGCSIRPGILSAYDSHVIQRACSQRDHPATFTSSPIPLRTCRCDRLGWDCSVTLTLSPNFHKGQEVSVPTSPFSPTQPRLSYTPVGSMAQ